MTFSPIEKDYIQGHTDNSPSEKCGYNICDKCPVTAFTALLLTRTGAAVRDVLLLLSEIRLVGIINLTHCNMFCKSLHSAEESDCLTEYEEDGMDTVREEEGEEEEEEELEDHSPGEWGPNGVFQTVTTLYMRE